MHRFEPGQRSGSSSRAGLASRTSGTSAVEGDQAGPFRAFGTRDDAHQALAVAFLDDAPIDRAAAARTLDRGERPTAHRKDDREYGEHDRRRNARWAPGPQPLHAVSLTRYAAEMKTTPHPARR